MKWVSVKDRMPVRAEGRLGEMWFYCKFAGESDIEVVECSDWECDIKIEPTFNDKGVTHWLSIPGVTHDYEVKNES